MHHSMRRIAGLFLFLLVWIPRMALSVEDSTATRDPSEYFFDQSFGNLREELQTARKEGKLGLFIMFDQVDCPWCAKMKATVLNQIPIQDYYRMHFRVLDVDIRGSTPIIDFVGREMTQEEFAFKVYHVRATPVFMFFDTDGKPLQRYTGATRNAQEFLWLAEFIVSGEYKTKNFTIYKRERLAAADKK